MAQLCGKSVLVRESERKGSEAGVDSVGDESDGSGLVGVEVEKVEWRGSGSRSATLSSVLTLNGLSGE